MALSDKSFVDKINSCLNRSLSEIQNAQLADSISKISTYKIDSVATFAALPLASENTGRIVFVVNEDVYYYSDGTSWSRDLNSNLVTSLYSWGLNLRGHLGDNSVVNKSSPVSVFGGFTDWCQVSAGASHTAAVRANGTLWTWGCGGGQVDACDGRLGNNCNTDRSSPVSVVGGFTDWCQVSAGDKHTAAVRQNGTLWTWGEAANGKLGNFSATNRCSPVSVCGVFTDWCQVSAGLDHTAAVRQNGTLWAWGRNCDGRLGDNCTTDRSSPVSVVGGFTDWCQVSAGDQHTAAVRQNGTIWAWGQSSFGRLGNNTGGVYSGGSLSPTSVVGGFTDWCQVSAGHNHTAAVRQNGTLWTWGYNCCGKLGDGTTTFKCSPVSVVGGFTDWCQVSVGRDHNAAIRTNGTLWTWGLGSSGRLGDNQTTNRSSPVSVVGLFTNWCQVSAGTEHTAAVLYIQGF